MGDDDFLAFVEEEAAGSSRTVVGHLALPPVGTVPDSSGLLAEAARHDWTELAVDESQFDRLREAAPGLLARAERVWISTREERASRQLFAALPLVGRLLKRLLDVSLAALGLVLLLPVLVLLVVLVKLESRGPGLHRQVRVGLGGRRFQLYKIRTMVVDSDDATHRAFYASFIRGQASASGGLFKVRHDPRITRIGRVLRSLSLDELPQLWNVLKGDMSLVGPRPMQPHELDLCPVEVWQRLRVKPGITGLWQVSGRSRLSFAEMIALDLRYCRSWSFLRDVSILLKTPRAVARRDGTA